MPWYEMTFREFHSKYAYINNEMLFQAADYCGLPPSAVVYLYFGIIALISFVLFVYYGFFRAFLLPVSDVLVDHPNNKYKVLMPRIRDIAELAGIEIRSTILLNLWIICLFRVLRWHGNIRQFLISFAIYWQKQLAQFMPWGVRIEDERVTLPLLPPWKTMGEHAAEDAAAAADDDAPSTESAQEEPGTEAVLSDYDPDRW